MCNKNEKQRSYIRIYYCNPFFHIFTVNNLSTCMFLDAWMKPGGPTQAWGKCYLYTMASVMVCFCYLVRCILHTEGFSNSYSSSVLEILKLCGGNATHYTTVLPWVVVLTVIFFSQLFLRVFRAIFSEVNFFFINEQGSLKQSHVRLIWIAL